MNYTGKQLNTMGEVFAEALRIAEKEPQNATDFMKQYANHIQDVECISLEDAMKRAKANIGYFAGYGDEKTVHLIYETYSLKHPIFGDI